MEWHMPPLACSHLGHQRKEILCGKDYLTTREQLDQCLLARTQRNDHYQAFNIAKSVARFSFGLTKKDDTGKVIDRFVDHLENNSSSDS